MFASYLYLNDTRYQYIPVQCACVPGGTSDSIVQNYRLWAMSLATAFVFGYCKWNSVYHQTIHSKNYIMTSQLIEAEEIEELEDK